MIKSALEYGQYYHIYNRGNNGEVLFKTPEYYKLFLELYHKYISPVADTLAYCLMSNHFHLLIRIKDEREVPRFTELGMFKDNKFNIITDKKPSASNQFAHLFNSYSKRINMAYQRTGSLFEHPFERRSITSEYYLLNCIAYIHSNPVKDHFVRKIQDYKWSSFNAIISDHPTQVNREFVLQLFGGKENFLLFHEQDPENFKQFFLSDKPQNILDF